MGFRFTDDSHGRDEEERLEGGVGLGVEIYSVSKPSPSRALGGEQHAGLLLREELDKEEMMVVIMWSMKGLTSW